MAASRYKRLPGRSGGFFYSSSLWEADDHLLLVHSYRVSESYRRIAYRDIEALVLCRTRTGTTMTIVCAALAVALASPIAFVSMAPAIALGFTAGVFLLAAAVNFLRGPTCRCTIKTAVQTQHLPTLKHLRAARKVFQHIEARVAAVQSATP